MLKPTPAGPEPNLVAELRSAILDAPVNRHRLAVESGVHEGAIRRFMSRERGLSLETAARIAATLGLRLIRPSKPRKFAPLPGRARPAPVDDVVAGSVPPEAVALEAIPPEAVALEAIPPEAVALEGVGPEEAGIGNAPAEDAP